MKFVSRNANLRLVLSPGIPAQPLAGIASKAGVYVKFENGIVDVKEETIVKSLLDHPGFGTDFVEVEDAAKDPYHRTESEPTHVITDLKYGHVEGRKVSKAARPSPEVEKMIASLGYMKKEEVVKMAKEMVAEAIAESLKAKTPSAPKTAAKGPAPETKE